MRRTVFSWLTACAIGKNRSFRLFRVEYFASQNAMTKNLFILSAMV